MKYTFILPAICALFLGNILSAQSTLPSGFLGDGMVQRERGELGQATTAFRKAKKLYADQSDFVNFSTAAALEAEVLAWAMKPDSAKKALMQAEELTTNQLGSSHPAVWQLRTLKLEVLRLDGKGDKALKAEEELINYWKKQGPAYIHEQGFCYLYLGKIRSDLGDFGGAIKNLEAAQLIFKAAPAQYAVPLQECYSFLANAYTFLGEPEIARKYLAKSQQIAQQYNPSPHFRTANLQRLRGTLEALNGKFDQAVVYYKSGLSELEQFREMKEAKAVLWSNIALMLGKKGKLDESVAAAQTSLALYEEGYGKRHQKLVKVFSNLAISYETKKNTEQSYAYSRRALQCLAPDWTPKSDFDLPGPESFNNTFLFLLKMTEAGKHAENIYAKNKNGKYLETAFNAYNWTIEAIDRMRNELLTEESQFSFQNYEQFRDCYDYALRAAWMLYERTKEEKYLQKALAYTEKRKSGILFSALQKKQALQFSGIPATVLNEEQTLKTKLNQAKTAWFEAQYEGVDENTLLGLRAKMTETDAAHSRLLQQLESKYPGYYEVRYAPNIPELKDLKAHLKAHKSTLLEYHVGGEADSALYIMRVSANDCQLHRIPIDANFAHVINQFIDLVCDDDQTMSMGNDLAYFKHLCGQSYHLYELLLKPVLTPEDQNIIIIPSDILYYLPFEMLLETPSTETKVNYSGLNWSIKNRTYRYAFSSGIMMTEPKRSKTPAFFAGFAPDLNGIQANTSRNTTTALRFVSEEVRSLAQLLNGASFIGPESNAANFRRAASEYRILHVASHAVTDEENPLLSYISLGDTTRLAAWQIYDWQIQSDLTVLSACNTGRGSIAGGEGVMSMARAFRYAGCPNLLVSLWQVDDESTRELMEHFYQRLKTGMPKQEALRGAKLEYLAAKHKTHPYFWAPFVLLGDDLPVINDSTLPPWWLFALAAAGVAAIIWYLNRPKPVRRFELRDEL